MFSTWHTQSVRQFYNCFGPHFNYSNLSFERPPSILSKIASQKGGHSYEMGRVIVGAKLYVYNDVTVVISTIT